jgi:3-isopropylmalate dehydratase small subunit
LRLCVFAVKSIIWHTINLQSFSSAVPLPIENVDTDQIIPARFLKATEAFGDNLLGTGDITERYSKADFVLNDATYSKFLLEEKTSVQVPP